ncbi:MAG: LysR substrate-binding domain-containing protein [Coriobacteriia bacterium]|nr:LysR substrate-binding domain-containing protein [Coriobacteriia bacterium]
MNISHLRAFVAIVEHGTFSGAARAMGLSQPAVTMQIQSLESDLGATVLERRYRKIDLTEAGRALLPYARKVLREVDAARDEIEKMSSVVGGHLELAASTTPGQYVLPRLLGPFLKQYPEVTVSLRVYDTADVISHVESGDVHFGMTGARIPGAKVEYEEMGVDQLLMIAPSDSGLAGRSDLTLAEVAERPFIMREQGSGTRIVFEEALRLGGADPLELQVVMELGTSEAIVSAVEGGMGIGVVSHWMADKALTLGTVSQLVVPHFPVPRPLFAVTPRGTRSRAAAALTEYLREALGR